MLKTRIILASACVLAALVSTTANAQFDLNSAIAALRAYDTGADGAPLEALNEHIVASHGDWDALRSVESALDGVLDSKQTSLAAKWYAAKQLYRIGTSESVPVLSRLLVRGDTSDLARYALERMDTPMAHEALTAAVGRTGGAVRAGIITSIGQCGSAGDVPMLRRYCGNGDPVVMRAALVALGAIGGADAAETLRWASENVRVALRPVATTGLLRCADRFLAEGDTQRAIALYDGLMIEAEAKQVRMAALAGLIAADGENGARHAVEILTSDDAGLYGTAAACAIDIPGDDATRALASALPDMQPAARVMAMGALEQRGGTAAQDALIHATSAREPEIRLAAYEALRSVGDENAVDVLLRGATSVNDGEQSAARRSLAQLSGEGIDRAIAAKALSIQNPLRAEVYRALAARHAKDASAVLLKAARSEVPELRVIAVEALGVLGDDSSVNDLVRLLVGAQTDEERTRAKRAIVALAKSSDESVVARAVEAGLKRAGKSSAARSALYSVLGDIGERGSIAVVLDGTSSKDGDVASAALRALCQWPTSEPAAPVVSLAASAKTEGDRAAAFTGAVRLVRLDSERTSAETMALYTRLAGLAKDTADKKLLLAGLAEVADPVALALVDRFAAEPDLADEARLAAEKIQERLKSS